MRTSTIWFCFLATVVVLLLTACDSLSSSSGGTVSASTPFSTFLQHVENARYSDYAQQKTTKVQNEQAFEEMRTYILTKYRGVQVTNTYINDGQTFDCVVQNTKLSTPPGASNPPATSTSTRGTNQSNTLPGNSSCQEGTIPMERITLEKLVQFPTLQAFLSKGPGKSSAPPTGSN